MKASVWLVAVMLAVALAACGPQGKVTVGKTHGGARTYLSEWQDIEPSKSLIDVAVLPKAIVNKVEQRIRDNRILHQRVYFDGNGHLFVEHMLGPNALFFLRVTTDTNNFSIVADGFKDWIGSKTDAAETNKKRIYSRGARGGWLTTVPVSSYRDCILARVGFLSRPEKNRTADEHYDTIVWYRDCTGKRTKEQVMDFLRGLKIVPSA